MMKSMECCDHLERHLEKAVVGDVWVRKEMDLS